MLSPHLRGIDGAWSAPLRPAVRVVTAARAAAIDQATIAAGKLPQQLLEHAGARATEAMLRHFADLLREHGALVFCGQGNNGGDGWVVARRLAKHGLQVDVIEVMAPRTTEAARAAATFRECYPTRVHAMDGFRPPALDTVMGVHVDALLGTGARGALRGPIAEAVAWMRRRRGHVTALDLPSGIDADTGLPLADGGQVVRAELTIAFGTLKRAHVLARDFCGRTVLADIQLEAGASEDDAELVHHASALARVPPISATAHKGTRGKLLIVGGAEGMAGAVILAARGALRSGVGMVRCAVAPESVVALQAAAPAAMASRWPATDAECSALIDWCDAIVVGPGLGRDGASGALLRRLLGLRTVGARTIPLLLDADALNLVATDAELRPLIEGMRHVLLTPHAVELDRLLGQERGVPREPFALASRAALELRTTVLSKGVPTIISYGGTGLAVVATGTPALATAGSGDVLSGIAGALLAQGLSAPHAGAAAAHAHGRAAEIAGERLAVRAGDGSARLVRGLTLDDVLEALPFAWRAGPPLPDGVLAELPAVGDDIPDVWEGR